MSPRTTANIILSLVELIMLAAGTIALLVALS